MDFPATLIEPPSPVLSSFGRSSPLQDTAVIGNNVFTANAWPAVNQARYAPVIVETPMLIKKMAIQVSVTAAGNIDVGIYNEKGTRLVNAGTTAIGGAGIQVLDVTDTWLDPGVYFLAMACSTITTATFMTAAASSRQVAQATGMLQQATAIPLPSTMTGIAPSSNGNFPWIIAVGAAGVI